MFMMFLSLIFGGFLLGCVAILTTITIIAVICGGYNGCTAVFRTSSDGLGKLVRLITVPTSRRSSKAIQA